MLTLNNLALMLTLNNLARDVHLKQHGFDNLITTSVYQLILPSATETYLYISLYNYTTTSPHHYITMNLTIIHISLHTLWSG